MNTQNQTFHRLNLRLPSTKTNRKSTTDIRLQLLRKQAHLKSKIAWLLAAYLIEGRENQLSTLLNLQLQYAAILHTLENLGVHDHA